MKKNGFVELILYIIAFAGAAIMLMPFVWMVDTSLKLPEEVQVWPPSWGTGNALSTRYIPAGIDHSAYAGVNYAALSLQQFLTSGNTKKEVSPNLLTIKLVGTPPVRGTLHVLLKEGKNNPKYATSVNKDEFKKVISDIDSRKYPSKFVSLFTKMKELESKPTEYMKEFITVFKYGDHPILSRVEYVNNLYQTGKTVQSFMNRFGPILARNPRLAIQKGDSNKTIEEKKFLKSFFSSGSYSKNVNSFLKETQNFKKGLGTLSNDENKLIQKFNELFSKIDLEKILNEKFGSVPPSMRGILNVYNSRAVQPLKEWMNLLISFKELENFYNSLRNIPLKNPEIDFTFLSSKQKEENLESAFKKAELPSYYVNLADKILKKQGSSNFLNAFIKSLNSNVKDDLVKLGYTPQKAAFVFGKLSSITSSMKILYSSLSNSQAKELDSMVKKYASDFSALALKINNAFSSEYPNSTQVLTGQLESVDAYLSKNTEKKDAVEQLLRETWEDQKAIWNFTNVYNDVYYTMKILKAPSVVKKVEYFPANGKIKIYFKNLNSVWFFNTNVHVKATFSFSQIWANLFQNYVDAWNAAPFARYYFNTVLVATITTFLNIIVGVMAAFAFSKLHFKGRNFLFMLFLATMMIPGEVLLVPNFITIVKFGWFNTYYALIIPWIASAFVIFLMRQNFMSVPDELFDAAKIDGASKWRFLWTILVPLSKPVIITGALLNFVGSWNAFLWVLIVTNTPSMRTLPVGLQNFSSNAGTMYNQLMAASTFSMLPIVILFLFAQKYFIQGIARSGLK
ncbi:ABC transporter permease subunit [Mesoaciditoga sp.]